MPAPIGGAICMSRHLGGARRASQCEYDPELEKFRELQRYMKENLEVTMQFFKVIPPKGGKVEGVMVLEAKENIEHTGMFILLKGLPVAAKRKPGRKPQLNVKFTVLGSTLGEGEGETMVIEGESRETYPLEIDVHQELPPPLITHQGKLIYRMQLFISTCGGKNIPVGEVPIRWQGLRVLTREEIEKPLKIEQQVATKRSYFGLGSRKCAQMEWRTNRGGYLPGEVIHIELLGETKENKMEIECRVELVQKVWYQVPSTTGSGQMWVKMKVNVMDAAGSEEIFEVEGGEESKVVWQGSLKVPKGITPSHRHDFTNSVNYTLRGSVGLAGDPKDAWVTGEVPLLVGSSKEAIDGEEEGEPEDEEEEEEEIDLEAGSTPQTPGSPVAPEGLHKRRASDFGIAEGGHKSLSMSFIAGLMMMRPRAGSISSVDSIFRQPPSYSQLSSRRPTQETLPPAYYDLELQEHAPGNLENPSSLAVEEDCGNEIEEEETKSE